MAIRESGHGKHADALLPPHRRRDHADFGRSGRKDYRSGSQVVEVDQSGKIVRSIAGTTPGLKMSWCSGTQALPDGGLLISDYTGKRLLEVDAEGKLVHELATGN
jgi:hypothetical protein